MLDQENGYIGRFQQGQELTLVLQCTTVAGAPNAPVLHPRVKIYRDASPPVLIETVVLAADQQGVSTVLFRLSHQLTGLYGTAGRYLLVFSWQDSNGAGRSRLGSFTLLPGGSPDGAVIAMFHVRRPNAGYLIRQTDSGLLIRGKNPR